MLCVLDNSHLPAAFTFRAMYCRDNLTYQPRPRTLYIRLAAIGTAWLLLDSTLRNDQAVS